MRVPTASYVDLCTNEIDCMHGIDDASFCMHDTDCLLHDTDFSIHETDKNYFIFRATLSDVIKKAVENVQKQFKMDVALLMNQQENVKIKSETSLQDTQISMLQELQETLTKWKTEQDSQIAKILENQSELITKLVTEIGEIKSQNDNIILSNGIITQSNKKLELSMSSLKNRYEDLRKEIDELKKERDEKNDYIKNLEKVFRDLHRKSRTSLIEICNIPKVESEMGDSLKTSARKIEEAIHVCITIRIL